MKLETKFAKRLEVQQKQYEVTLAKELATQKEHCEKELQEKMMSMMGATSKAFK